LAPALCAVSLARNQRCRAGSRRREDAKPLKPPGGRPREREAVHKLMAEERLQGLPTRKQRKSFVNVAT
jgi:hypothetical protein